MGLTSRSTGSGAIDRGLQLEKRAQGERVVALAGNPNVGKSTVFNGLTGMRQHTGNWPGKTVSSAEGRYTYAGNTYLLVDIPGSYSLSAHSAEEAVACDFLCFQQPDVVIVVCDATCLERNLPLVLQILELTRSVVVCVNLMDEAGRKGIQIDLEHLSDCLGIPVVETAARNKQGLEQLKQAVAECVENPPASIRSYRFSGVVEEAVDQVEPALRTVCQEHLPVRWLAYRLLEKDTAVCRSLEGVLQTSISDLPVLKTALETARTILKTAGISAEQLRDQLARQRIKLAEEICRETVYQKPTRAALFDRRLDRILTGRWTGIPVMLLLLAGVFWLTISGANYISDGLSAVLFGIQEELSDWLLGFGAPGWLEGIFIQGAYRTLAWVVSVMLPPMAIFFPLFTLLEDLGYLPRVAFNLDHTLKKCGACGKQALTMCMGFGCNAAGVVGCRIIDSPRERLIAILTNNFVPCNGRFPTLIAILTMFFVSTAGRFQPILAAVLLMLVILLGIGMTFLCSKLLSKTILKGIPSSFTLELPPYRPPQVGQVLVRSIFDRTLFVLGRAVAVAAPAGAVLWILANATCSGETLLAHLTAFFNPFGQLLGLDGVILTAFLLGLPANEIVVPIMLMAYLSTGSLSNLDSLEQTRQLLIAEGWTGLTAINMMLFCLLHWPCSTTCLTIHKETGSWKWTAAAFLLPTAVGVIACLLVRLAGCLIGSC